MLNILSGLVPAETPSPSLPLLKDWESRELWNPATSCTCLFFYIWLIYVKMAAICTCFFYICTRSLFKSSWYFWIRLIFARAHFSVASKITMWDFPFPATLALVKFRMMPIRYICRYTILVQCTCYTVCPTQYLSFLGEKKIWTVLSHLRLSGHFERRSRNLTSPPRPTRWRRDTRFGSFAK